MSFFKKEKKYPFLPWVWKSLIIFAWSVRLHHSVNFENHSSVPYLSKGGFEPKPLFSWFGFFSSIFTSPHAQRKQYSRCPWPQVHRGLDSNRLSSFCLESWPHLASHPHVSSPNNHSLKHWANLAGKNPLTYKFSPSLSKAIIKAIAVVQLLKSVLVLSSHTGIQLVDQLFRSVLSAFKSMVLQCGTLAVLSSRAGSCWLKRAANGHEHSHLVSCKQNAFEHYFVFKHPCYTLWTLKVERHLWFCSVSILQMTKRGLARWGNLTQLESILRPSVGFLGPPGLTSYTARRCSSSCQSNGGGIAMFIFSFMTSSLCADRKSSGTFPFEGSFNIDRF